MAVHIAHLAFAREYSFQIVVAFRTIGLPAAIVLPPESTHVAAG